jgi:hypothetical protein
VDKVKITIPDVGIMMHALDKVKSHPSEYVYICQIVVDKLQEEVHSSNAYNGRLAQKALEYIHGANLKILPDPEPFIYDLFGMDNQHQDEVIIATYCELFVKGAKNVQLHVSNEMTAKKVKRAEKQFQKFMDGDYSNIERARKEYLARKKKRVIQTGQTGLAKTREVKDKFEPEQGKKLPFHEIRKIVTRSLISLVVLAGLFLLLDNAPSNDKEAATSKESTYEIKQLAFDNIEIQLKSVDGNDHSSVLRYEMINRNAHPIVFGYDNEENPIDGKKREKHLLSRGGTTIQTRFKDNIVDYQHGTYTLEPNQITDVKIMIDGPLENFIGVDTFMKNEATGEVRRWSYDFAK